VIVTIRLMSYEVVLGCDGMRCFFVGVPPLPYIDDQSVIPLQVVIIIYLNPPLSWHAFLLIRSSVASLAKLTSSV
jgi:hypothetical protein